MEMARKSASFNSVEATSFIKSLNELSLERSSGSPLRALWQEILRSFSQTNHTASLMPKPERNIGEILGIRLVRMEEPSVCEKDPRWREFADSTINICRWPG